MLPLAVTMGEPAGVGPELIGQAWLGRRTSALPCFYALADPVFLERRFAEAGLEVSLATVDAPGRARDAFDEALPVCALAASVARGAAGRPDPTDAEAVLEAIRRAVKDVVGGEARALVTAPVQKETLYGSGFSFPGHTEYLGALAREHGMPDSQPVMMLASDALNVVPVTVHIPLADVPAALTRELIVATGLVVDRDLRQRFGVASPRLAIAGLNPHAGEGGRMGAEDREIVAPAVRALVANGIRVAGPLPADTMFHAAARAKYDAALCMYHDQALIPVKALAFESAVNVTLGMPFVRTSPDHGTALALAGTGGADPSSFVAALRLADRLTRP